MYSFNNDYSEGAHPDIMEALMRTNMEQTGGYSLDTYTEEAIHNMKNLINCQNADIHLLVGGTQTNLTALSAFLRPHHAIIAASTAHIAVHETGAIEATGHKVIIHPTDDGKLNVNHIRECYEAHTDEHMVKPKLVYISNPTELGTIYSKAELEEISCYCKENQLFLYLDGARMASALTAIGNDIALSDYAKYTDAFYIGGTKSGALFGEALVICNDNLKEDFRYHIKQKGGMLAKGRLLAIQFNTLFTNHLYETLGEHSNKMAYKLKEGITSLGYRFLVDSQTNQQFPIFPNNVIIQLEKEFLFSFQAKIDENHSAIRLVTSWATREDKVEKFIEVLRNCK
ncbi:threonine aldolase family protein [Anaeromicropila herbilytica]|uniref:Amino acid lyase n=1 Tax=Anaeromicropila herbilytica TaxID=2785025 RepID=A0A7R7ID70_9FIRM|nr:aminotransferase class I/II-fold pyridoxal phosphate-dependent enzyme [Anaeromicropila herbilytica]BCN30724.1 amino acid lyase [Anaeromicropila herbilytica]